MDNRGADLALDVIADDRQSSLLEATSPVGIRCDKYGNAIDEGASRFECTQCVVFGRTLGADGQIRHEHLRTSAFEYVGHIALGAIGLGNIFTQIGAKAVQRSSSL